MARTSPLAGLPITIVLLILSALANTRTTALTLPFPRETKVIDPQVLNVVPFPPVATSAPIDLRELLRRQDTNTICGYVGGNPSLAATCSIGSHCVLDQEHKAVGCCPNGEAICTTGVYTGCVDYNSPAQTVLNPYVYTCQGRDLCYKNTYDGGVSQYGCGTASNMGTSVALSPTGVATSAASLLSSNIPFVYIPSSLAQPTSIGSNPGTAANTANPSSTGSNSNTNTDTNSQSSTSNTASPTTSGASSSSSSASNTAPAAAGSPTTGAPATHIEATNTGAIIGGSVAGLVVLGLLLACCLFFCLRRRKRRRNQRVGPGARRSNRGNNTSYVSPMSGTNNNGFAPVHRDNRSWEEGLPANHHHNNTNNNIATGPMERNDHYDNRSYPQTQQSGLRGGGSGSPLSDASVHPALRDQHGFAPATTAGVGSAAYASHHDGSGYNRRSEGGADDDHHQTLLPPQHHLHNNHSNHGEFGQPSPELEDFSRGYGDALSRIGEEEDEDDMPGHGHGYGHGHGHGYSNSGDLGEGVQGGQRPLWTQQRRKSRNQMWT